jgi:hypothetical protein
VLSLPIPTTVDLRSSKRRDQSSEKYD